MPWVRLDDHFADHPKIVQAGPLALAFQVAGLCYCNRYLTEGVIPAAKARTLLDVDDPGLVIKALLEAEIWEEDPEGFRIHDYEDFQPSREEVMAERTIRNEAQRAGGLARVAGAVRNDAGQFVSAGQTSSAGPAEPATDQLGNQVEGQEKASPVPGPVPVPSTQTRTPMSRARKNIEAAEWKPTPELLEWAAEEHPNVDLVLETEKFIDHFSANGKPMKNWNAAWKNWIRRVPDFSRSR